MDAQSPDRPRGPLQTGFANFGEPPMLLSVVIPCMNEEEVLRQTNKRLTAVLEQAPVNFELIYVDDGSTDSTSSILRELQSEDHRIRAIRLSRNFGHQITIIAGIEHSGGKSVVI